MGEGSSQTIKRLTKSPSTFSDLSVMLAMRISDRLSDVEEFYIYYEDISNGMIRIEDSTDLSSAIDYCELYSKKSLKLYGKCPRLVVHLCSDSNQSLICFEYSPHSETGFNHLQVQKGL